MSDTRQTHSDNNRWNLIRSVTEKALDLEPSERVAFIERSCGHDASLVDDVIQLLASTEEARDESGSSASRIHAVHAGSLIDDFELVEPLGEGGFGAVWLANQTKPVKRQVALKIIKPGMDSSQVVARFEAERQALALMEHPNIACVFDGGETADGHPYFVMELVRGVSITQYCAQHALDIRTRIKLFQDVCSAVQHAHQKGVIHRDLKPNNILVTEVDGEPIPKVIDFGIAKALEKPLTDRTLFTEFRQFLGTPEYMSPEQTSFSLCEIDTRSDVYALGVLLYELLAGSPPFDPDSLRLAGFDEMRRIIQEDHPPLPSVKLSQSTRHDVGRNDRHLDSRRLQRTVRGELDWIVLRAMEKERDRRYPSASELSADLERYLLGEPIDAGPLSRSYRLRRFARAHRIAVAFGTLSLAALLAIACVLGISAAMLSAKVSQLEKARVETDRQRAVTQAVNQFLTEDLLAAAAPSAEAGEGRDVLLRTVLDEASLAINRDRFEDDPDIKAAIHKTIGETYVQLGLYKEAEGHLHRALELQQSTSTTDAEELMSTKNTLGVLFLHTDRFKEAEAFRTEVYEWYADNLGEEHPKTLEARTRLGSFYDSVGRDDEAEEHLRAVLALYERTSPENREGMINPLGLLSSFLQLRGRVEESTVLLERALALSNEVRGPSDPRTMTIHHNLGVNLLWQNRHEEARDHLLTTLEYANDVLGPEHPGTLTTRQGIGDAFYGLAQKAANAGDKEAAQDLYDQVEQITREVHAIRVRVLGENHSETLMTLNLLATVLSRKDPHEAESVFREIYEHVSSRFPPEHPRSIQAAAQIAFVCTKTGKFTEAADRNRDVLEVLERVAPGHPNIKHVRGNLISAEVEVAKDLFERGDLTGALMLLEPNCNEHIDSNPKRNSSKLLLGRVYHRMERLDDADRLFKEVIEKCDQTIAYQQQRLEAGASGADQVIREVQLQLAAALFESGQLERALELSRETHAWCTGTLGPEHATTAKSAALLADLLNRSTAQTGETHRFAVERAQRPAQTAARAGE